MPPQTATAPTYDELAQQVEELTDDLQELRRELEETAGEVEYVAAPLRSAVADVLAVLDRWHDQHHGVGRRHHCHEQLCRDVTSAATG